MYLQLNTEGSSCNNCSSGKVICITYSDSVFVALGIQHAMRMRHIVFCGLSGSHYLINDRIFRKKKLLKWNVWLDFLYNFCINHFLF